MATGNLDTADLRAKAIQHKCKIIHEQRCNHENGFYVGANCAETAETIKDFLLKWQKMETDCRKKIEKQGSKFTNEEDMDAKVKNANEHAEQLLVTQKKIM